MTTPITKTQALAKFKPLLTLAVGFLAALGVLSLTHTGPAQADNAGGLPALVARLNADDAKLAADDAKLAALQAILPTPGPKGDTGAPGTNGAGSATGQGVPNLNRQVFSAYNKPCLIQAFNIQAFN